MNYFWVNVGFSYDAQISNNLLWAPANDRNGAYNQTFQNIKSVRKGDFIFAMADRKIKAVGIAADTYFNSTKPTIMVNDWVNDGWRVNVQWIRLKNGFIPRTYNEHIQPLLPAKHKPLNRDGNGNQKCYLAHIGPQLGSYIISRAKDHNDALDKALKSAQVEIFNQETEIEQAELVKIYDNSTYSSTEKQQLSFSRRGQGVFRDRVEQLESGCRITNLDVRTLLVASHIKPWSKSNDYERLDGNNGLLLSPHIDQLFDKGYISFSDAGNILISPSLPGNVFQLWNIDQNLNVGRFNDAQKTYLSYHRQYILRS